jgi:DNA-binding NarL/FixJ family response regulator
LVDRIRVYCVDDTALVRDALRVRLSVEAGIDLVGEAGDADGLVQESLRLRPDVVLLDLRMPGMPPLEALTHLTKACPDTRTLVLSGQVDENDVDRAIEAGAWGYILKTDGPETIVRGIRAVARGQMVLGAADGA